MSLPHAMFGLAAALAFTATLHAHPVPKNNYDRTITVRLQRTDAADTLALRIDYRLEVDETTVVLEDMKPYRDQVDYLDFRGKPLEYYAHFTRLYAPVIADRLLVSLNGEPVKLTAFARGQKLHDDKGEPLGHLRCDFDFRGTLQVQQGQPNKLFVKELNYEFYDGQMHLSFVNEAGADLYQIVEPDAALRQKPVAERQPGDEEKLRTVRATFVPPLPDRGEAPAPSEPVPAPAPAAAPERPPTSYLFRLFFHDDLGFLAMLVVATFYGAAHALTPGHGKTLVAAYLVGQRGTIGHAFLLGLVTTLTHTGAVLIVALAMYFSRELGDTLLDGIKGLSLGMGLVMICLASYLLLLRLAGRSDHVHLGGGHHHHETDDRKLTFWGLVFVGILGGLMPCWDAIFLLLFTIGSREFWLALPLLTAFSAGLAGTLVLVGVLVVKSRQFAESRWGNGRLVRALPIVSAVLMIALGFALCYEAIHAK